MLDPAIVALRDDLKQCSADVKEIEAEFHVWRDMAMELSEAAASETCTLSVTRNRTQLTISSARCDTSKRKGLGPYQHSHRDGGREEVECS